eukprot:gene485-911_t
MAVSQGLPPSSNRRRVFLSDSQLLLAAISFSASFVLQRASISSGLKPFIFNSSRFLLSTTILLTASPFLPESLKTIKNSESSILSIQSIFKFEKQFWATLKWGFILGCLNFSGTTFQQWGISLTSASKCAFMTGFYVFFVPIVSSCISSKNKSQITYKTWLSITISVIGLFLLSDASIQDMSIGRGEALTLIGTIFWTAHVIVTDTAMNYVDTISVTVLQFFTVACISFYFSYILEYDSWSNTQMYKNFHWILSVSLAEGLGFFLAAIGQRFSPPNHVAFIFSLESVFTSLGGYIFLNEILSTRDLIGCVLLISSTILSQCSNDIENPNEDIEGLKKEIK